MLEEDKNVRYCLILACVVRSHASQKSSERPPDPPFQMGATPSQRDSIERRKQAPEVVLEHSMTQGTSAHVHILIKPRAIACALIHLLYPFCIL